MASITQINNEGAFDSTIRKAINDNFSALAGLGSGSASYIVSDSGTKTLASASTVDRTVTISLAATTTFANGNGAQPTVALGQTGSTSKFAATSEFTGITAGTTKTYTGTLSANTALLATEVAGTGTATGAYTISWVLTY